MEITALDTYTRAISSASLSRNLSMTTAIGISSSLVTLHLITSGSAPILAISVVIISTFLYVSLSAGSTIDQFKVWIADDKEQDASNMEQPRHQTPFTLWKTVYSLCFFGMAATQLLTVWV